MLSAARGEVVVPGTRLQLGNRAFLCGWLVRSPGTVYHWPFLQHLHYQRSKTCSRHICSHVPTSLTNCFAEYEQRTEYGALLVTLAMLLRLISCGFIMIIIIADHNCWCWCSRIHDGHDVLFVAARRSGRSGRSRDASVYTAELHAQRLLAVVHSRFVHMVRQGAAIFREYSCKQRTCMIKLQHGLQCIMRV